ncbi:hypothetical protein H1C71_000129, partial [Ictidomys tridecemlineatus]
VNPARWRSLQVCSEAEKRCNKQVPLPPLTPSILPYKCSALLALLRVKSPSSCLTLLREHDGRPCHLKCLQQSDAPNLSSRQTSASFEMQMDESLQSLLCAIRRQG